MYPQIYSMVDSVQCQYLPNDDDFHRLTVASVDLSNSSVAMIGTIML
jgi:hypothetical protein